MEIQGNPRFWSYVRWSSDPQEWGDSERRQDDAAIACAARLGVPLIDGYRDEGTSAWTGANATKGGNLRRFIDDIGKGEDRPHPGDFLGIESFDRLSRMERLDSIGLVREIVDSGISICPTMMPGVVINRHTMRQQPWIFDYMSAELGRANSESERKSERVRAAKSEARERARAEGTPVAWGTCPGWLTLVDVKRVGNKIVSGRYVVNERAEIVRQIFKWAAQGRGGAWIAHQLNAAETPVFRKPGPRTEKLLTTFKWYPVTVRRLLRDWRVIGWLQPCIRVGGKPVPDGPALQIYPAIIDEALWAKVRSILRRQPGESRGGSGGTVNLVRGLCKCEVCGKGLSIRRQRGREYLVCSMASAHSSCSNRRYFPYEDFEAFLLNVALFWDLPGLLGSESGEHVSQVPALEEKIDALRSRRRGLIAEFDPGDADARQVINDLAAQIDEAQKALVQAREDDLIARHEESDGTQLQRVYEQITRLRSRDAKIREEARLQLQTELRRHVRAVTLRADRTIELQIGGAPFRVTGSRLGALGAGAGSGAVKHFIVGPNATLLGYRVTRNGVTEYEMSARSLPLYPRGWKPSDAAVEFPPLRGRPRINLLRFDRE